jgi:glycosyltransferase involved in cell wall biosynthesis
MAEAPRTSLIQEYDIPPSAVTVVGCGPNVDYPKSLAGLGELSRYETRTVLFVGRHDFERKGGPELLEAFYGVREALPEARLRIVGVRLPRDPPGVRSFGEVLDHAELTNLYRTSSVFCMPSRFEPLGIAISEAMAYGLPVVGTRVGGIPEAIRDGQTGIVVEPGDIGQLRDALIRLLTNTHEAATMGNNGRKVIDTHQNWEAVVDRMLAAVRGRSSAMQIS